VVEEEVDPSLVLCLESDKGGRSFLLPGIRMLANLSNCKDKRKTVKTGKCTQGFSVPSLFNMFSRAATNNYLNNRLIG